MTADSGTLERSEIPVPVDFTKPPTALEPYTFGKRVTRNSFTSFAMDGFTKSRGELDVQYAYLRYLSFHDGSITETLGNFENAGGVGALTDEESTAMVDGYYKIKNHITNLGRPGEPNEKFTGSVTRNIAKALEMMRNIGKEVDLDKFKVTVVDLPEDVLNMSPQDFLGWLSTEGRYFSPLK